jgi:hypothetical protein
MNAEDLVDLGDVLSETKDNGGPSGDFTVGHSG